MDASVFVFIGFTFYFLSVTCVAAGLQNGSMAYHKDMEVLAVAAWWLIYLIKFLLKSFWQAVSKW